MSKSLEALLGDIMSSKDWSGSVVIECFPDDSKLGKGVEVHWRTEDQSPGEWPFPVTKAATIREALTIAAKEARALK